MIINCFDDFTYALREAGFSIGGGNNENVFTLLNHSINDSYYLSSDIQWHTDNPETDPWEWRMRVLKECDDIAYSKVFFRKSGYITKEWYPYFYHIRRNGKSFEDEYYEGKISSYAKRVYDVIHEHGSLPFHEIKQFAGFTREDKSKFEQALVELQMRMYITMCGRQQKISQKGIEYGWSSTVFCIVEDFFDKSVFEKADKLTMDEAVEKIKAQVYKLNPTADAKKLNKFIMG